MSTSQNFAVYKLKLLLAMADPDMPSPRYHTVIFVETHAQGTGTGVKHHVTGDIVKGMQYESENCPKPESSETFHSKEWLGHVTPSVYAADFDSFLRAIPAPAPQKAFNPRTMKTEPFKTFNPLTFYKVGEPRRPLVKCTEWAEQQAIPALIQEGLLLPK